MYMLYTAFFFFLFVCLFVCFFFLFFFFCFNAGIEWSVLNDYQSRVSNYQICILNERIRAVTGQRSSPGVCFATISIQFCDP